MSQPLDTFLTALFGEAAEGWLNIFTLPDRHSETYPAAKMRQAYTYIANQAAAQNVYFTVGLLKAPPAKGRGDSALVSWLPTLHADIDIRHAAHRKQDLPPTMADALSLLTPIPLPPSILLNSGHGLHAYWLLRELWYLDTDDERTQAYHLLCRLQATIREAARKQGWTLDSTFDIARVLRLPGTMNHNGGGVPVPVELMEIWPDRRYNPSEFSPYLVKMDALTNGNGGPVHLPDHLPDGIDANALTVSTHIKYLIIDGTDRLNPSKYPSRSEAVAAVIRALLSTDYDDPTIASLLLDPRYKISEKPIEQGRTWVEGELQRLRSKPAPSLMISPPGQDQPAASPEQDTAPLPYIMITSNLSAVVDSAQQAILVMTGEPRIYQRARRLSVVARSAKSPKWLRRPEGTPVIITPAGAHVREVMAQSATWAKYDKRAKTWGETP